MKTQGINHLTPGNHKNGSSYPHPHHYSHHHNQQQNTRINNRWSLIATNINGLDSPLRRHRLTQWVWKQDNSSAESKKHTSISRIEDRGLEKDTPRKWTYESSWCSHFNKIDYKPKLTKGRGRHYIFTKGKIHQDDIWILNIYSPNIRTLKFVIIYWWTRID